MSGWASFSCIRKRGSDNVCDESIVISMYYTSSNIQLVSCASPCYQVYLISTMCVWLLLNANETYFFIYVDVEYLTMVLFGWNCSIKAICVMKMKRTAMATAVKDNSVHRYIFITDQIHVKVYFISVFLCFWSSEQSFYGSMIIKVSWTLFTSCILVAIYGMYFWKILVTKLFGQTSATTVPLLLYIY